MSCFSKQAKEESALLRAELRRAKKSKLESDRYGILLELTHVKVKDAANILSFLCLANKALL
jgi:hypothetical protein